ncbi:MAG: hypothetical protein QXK06_02545, partial [Candidatus Diapherotrites archaeon]
RKSIIAKDAKPFILRKPDSPAAKAVIDIAAKLGGGTKIEIKPERPPSFFGKIFGKLFGKKKEAIQ